MTQLSPISNEKIAAKIAKRAIEESIRQWERNRDADTPDSGEVNLSHDLCRVFLNMGHALDCSLCPVRKMTGEGLCYGTPRVSASNVRLSYMRIKDLGDGSEELLDSVAGSFKGYCQAEIYFLKSLPEFNKNAET